MTDDPIFRSAERAEAYVERHEPPAAQQLRPPVVHDEEPSRRERRKTALRPVPQSDSATGATQQTRNPSQLPNPMRQLVQQVPQAEELDVEALSRDLSGSWLTSNDDATADGTSSQRAQRGWRGSLAKIGLPVKPGKDELAAQAEARELQLAETVVRQATWTRCVTILVAQRKGGVGKTPVSILLGGTLAHIRGGGVVIPEVSDDPGMIALRSEGSPKRGLGELIQDVSNVQSAGQLAGYTAPQTSHAAVIGSPNPRPILTPHAVQDVHELLSSYYALQVLDSGNVYGSPAFKAAVELTDALVIPVTDAADSIQDALALIHHLSQTEYGKRLVASATVLRLRYVEATPKVVGRVDAVLQGLGVGRIIDVPTDPHIAEHGELSLTALQPETRSAFLRAAAGVVQSLQNLESR